MKKMKCIICNSKFYEHDEKIVIDTRMNREDPIKHIDLTNILSWDDSVCINCWRSHIVNNLVLVSQFRSAMFFRDEINNISYDYAQSIIDQAIEGELITEKGRHFGALRNARYFKMHISAIRDYLREHSIEMTIQELSITSRLLKYTSSGRIPKNFYSYVTRASQKSVSEVYEDYNLSDPKNFKEGIDILVKKRQDSWLWT